MDRIRLGATIRAARLARGLSLRAMAEQAGVNHETWRRAEAGEHVKDDNLTAICKALGLAFIGVDILIGDAGGQDYRLPDVPKPRRAVAARVLGLLPRMTDKQVDGLIGILDLWELQIGPEDGE